MKIAVSGKGGVGKTTFSAMLAAALNFRGHVVIALDADPDANLAAALGVPVEAHPTPLSEMKELADERTRAAAEPGGYFKLNPKVDDIPETYARHIGNIRLLALGGVSEGGGGCICPASALVKALLTHVILGRDDSIVMDMEAGIEHLGRATAQSMDALVIVVNDSPWSVQTARRIRKLAGDLGMKKLFAVANHLADPADAGRIADQLDGIPLIGQIPYDERIARGVVRLEAGDVPVATEGLAAHLPTIESILAELQQRI